MMDDLYMRMRHFDWQWQLLPTLLISGFVLTCEGVSEAIDL